MGRPKKDPKYIKDKSFQIRLSEADLNRLDGLAKWANMNRSETVRSLIKEAENYYILCR